MTKRIAIALIAALTALGGIAGPASAGWWGPDGRWHEDRRWHRGERYYGHYYRPPPVVYGTPYNYYTPPPVVYDRAPGPSFSITVRP